MNAGIAQDQRSLSGDDFTNLGADAHLQAPGSFARRR